MLIDVATVNTVIIHRTRLVPSKIFLYSIPSYWTILLDSILSNHPTKLMHYFAVRFFIVFSLGCSDIAMPIAF